MGPVDRTPGRGLRMDLMEQICTTIWANKPSLLRTLQVCEESHEHTGSGNFAGRISKENLKRTLRSLNASLGGSNRAAPLTSDQIDILVDHAECDSSDRLNYQQFLDSIQIVDTNPPPDDTSPTGANSRSAFQPPPRAGSQGSAADQGSGRRTRSDGPATRSSKPTAKSSPHASPTGGKRWQAPQAGRR